MNFSVAICQRRGSGKSSPSPVERKYPTRTCPGRLMTDNLYPISLSAREFQYGWNSSCSINFLFGLVLFWPAASKLKGPGKHTLITVVCRASILAWNSNSYFACFFLSNGTIFICLQGFFLSLFTDSVVVQSVFDEGSEYLNDWQSCWLVKNKKKNRNGLRI